MARAPDTGGILHHAGVVDDVHQVGADALAEVVGGASPFLQEHVRLHAVAECLVGNDAGGDGVGHHIVGAGRHWHGSEHD